MVYYCMFKSKSGKTVRKTYRNKTKYLKAKRALKKVHNIVLKCTGKSSY